MRRFGTTLRLKNGKKLNNGGNVMRKRYSRRSTRRKGYTHHTTRSRRGKTRRIKRYGASRGGIRM